MKILKADEGKIY
jgi:hypothetical protein